MFTVFTCFQNATTWIPEAQGKEMDETPQQKTRRMRDPARCFKS
jgi:hypothetical protein